MNIKIKFILLLLSLCINTNAQEIRFENGKGNVTDTGVDTSLYKVLFYIDDKLQNSVSDIYFIDSLNKKVIIPDFYLCDTCKTKLYYKHNIEEKVTVVFTNNNMKIVIPNFTMYSTTTEIEFGIISKPQKLVRVYEDKELLKLDEYERNHSKTMYYSPLERQVLYFYNMDKNVKLVQYIYVSSDSRVGPYIFYKYIYNQSQ